MSSRKGLVLTATICAALSFTSAFASNYHGNNPIVVANNEAGIAATGTHMNYLENLSTSPSDSETGWMPGFAVKYSLMGDYFPAVENLYFSVQYQFSTGNVAYKGGYIGTHKVLYSTTGETTNRVIARLGKGFYLSRNMMLTPYFAGGYQGWNRKLSSSEIENYKAELAGIGAKFQYALNSRLVFGVDAEWLALLGGSMTPNMANLPDLGVANFDISGEEKVGFNADYRISGPFHIYGGVNYTHFNYTGGLLNGGYFEPSSATNLLGMNLGLAYAF
jgi:hypothetical protein